MSLLFWLACTSPATKDSPHETAGDSAAVEDTWPEEEVEDVGPAYPPTLTVDPPGGSFSDEVEVTLGFQGADVQLYYTLNGDLPDEGAELYTEPLVLDATAQLRVLAVGPSRLEARATHTYVRTQSDLDNFSSNLPLMVLTSDNRSPTSDGDHTPFSLQIYEPGDDGRARIAGPATTDERMGLKVRGSSSANYPKLPYGFEIWSDEDNEDHDVPLLDMPAESDWVLLAPLNFDRALMRNALAYQLSNDVGRYAPRTRFIELYIADRGDAVGQEHYRGVYLVLERIKRSPDRVDITALRPEDVSDPEVTGGYIFKEDRREGGEDGFTGGTAGGQFDFQQSFVWVDPKEEETVSAQRAYLQDQVDELGWALAAADFRNPDTGRHYSEIIDVDSWIDHHILNVFPKNPDAFRLSGYFHKDREGLIAAGPVWDFDRTIGCSGGDSRPANPTWWDPTNQTSDTTDVFDHGFWLGLFRDPVFVTAWVARWEELLGGPLGMDNVNDQLDSWEAELSEAAPRNYARWPDYSPRSGGLTEEVDHMQSWLQQRHDWITACMSSSDPVGCQGN